VAEASHAVFPSYASQDAEAAQRIREALRSAGIEVWFDQSALRGGDVWDQTIRKQIKSCVLFIPVISRNTHDREEGYRAGIEVSKVRVAECLLSGNPTLVEVDDLAEKRPLAPLMSSTGGNRPYPIVRDCALWGIPALMRRNRITASAPARGR